MKYIKIFEEFTANAVSCDNCEWSWEIEDGGNDVFICHKCGHDNEPVLGEKVNINKDMKHIKVLEEFINEARQAPAKNLFKMVVNGSTSEIEGVKISKDMAQAALDWFDRSTYARKYEKQVKTAGMGVVAPLIFGDNWGIKKTISSKLKAEFKELQAQYKREMAENVDEDYSHLRSKKPAGLSKEETKKVAQKFADALSKVDKKEYTVNPDIEEDSFDLDVDGLEFDGGSYNINSDGTVVNMAVWNSSNKSPVYGDKDDDVKTIMKKIKKLNF